MPRPKTKEEIKKEEIKAEEKIGTSAIDVLDKGGNYVRTYSVAVQGKDFFKYAEMYSKKIGGSLRKLG